MSQEAPDDCVSISEPCDGLDSDYDHIIDQSQDDGGARHCVTTMTCDMRLCNQEYAFMKTYFLDKMSFILGQP